MSSLSHQRMQSKSKQGTQVSTGSFREKLQRKLTAMEMPHLERQRLRHLIQVDPVAARDEMRGMAAMEEIKREVSG